MLKELLLIRSSDKGELFRKKSNRLETWHKILLILIGLLIFIKLLFLLSSPQEIVKFSFMPGSVIHLLLITLVFLLFWLILWYFLYLKSEIKLEERSAYLKIYYIITIVVAISNLLFSIIIYLQVISHYFSINTDIISHDISIGTGTSPLLYFNLILLIVVIVLFTLFILKRSVRIIKQYWISILLIIITSFFYLYISVLKNLGWFDNTHMQLMLFSISYTFLGWIFLLLLIFSLFCNASSIMLYTSLNKFINPVKYKHQVITLIKIGFVSLLAVVLLSMIPDVLLWIYA